MNSYNSKRKNVYLLDNSEIAVDKGDDEDDLPLLIGSSLQFNDHHIENVKPIVNGFSCSSSSEKVNNGDGDDDDVICSAVVSNAKNGGGKGKSGKFSNSTENPIFQQHQHQIDESGLFGELGRSPPYAAAADPLSMQIFTKSAPVPNNNFNKRSSKFPQQHQHQQTKHGDHKYYLLTADAEGGGGDSGRYSAPSPNNGSHFCHSDSYSAPSGNNDGSTARRQLTAAAVMCLIFLIGEFIGGYLAHSLAIMTDAAHMLSDFSSFLISLFAVWLSGRRPNKKLSFGYNRAEILGALISILIIWCLTVILIYMAVHQILTKEYYVDADIMLTTAGLSIIFNILMAIALSTENCHIKHGHSHSGHSHNNNNHNKSSYGDCPSYAKHHSSSSTNPINDVTKNINVRAALIHVIGDFIQSVGVFVAALCIKFAPNKEWAVADPICTFIFSVLVLLTTVPVVRDAVRVLMEGAPSHVTYDEIFNRLTKIDGVVAVHDLHIWCVTMEKSALAVHLAISDNVDPLLIVKTATRLVRTTYNFAYTTIQVEEWDEPTMKNCHKCAVPKE